MRIIRAHNGGNTSTFRNSPDPGIYVMSSNGLSWSDAQDVAVASRGPGKIDTEADGRDAPRAGGLGGASNNTNCITSQTVRTRAHG